MAEQNSESGETTTPTAPTSESIKAQMDALMVALGEAQAAGDIAKVIATSQELQKASKALDKLTEEAEVGLRTAAYETVAKQLVKLDIADVLFNSTVTGVVKRDEAGVFTELTIAVSVNDEALEKAFWTVFDDKAIKDIKSLKAMKFTAPQGEGTPTVEHGGSAARRAGTTSGGGGGKGWLKGDGEDGKVYRLGEIFNEYATEAQKDELKGGDGNAQYTLKKTVAKEAGYKPKTD